MPGTAIPRMIPIIPTTTISSIRVKAWLLLVHRRRQIPSKRVRRRGMKDKDEHEDASREWLLSSAKMALGPFMALFADRGGNREHRRKHAEQKCPYPKRHHDNHGRLDQVGH